MRTVSFSEMQVEMRIILELAPLLHILRDIAGDRLRVADPRLVRESAHVRDGFGHP